MILSMMAIEPTGQTQPCCHIRIVCRAHYAVAACLCPASHEYYDRYVPIASSRLGIQQEDVLLPQQEECCTFVSAV